MHYCLLLFIFFLGICPLAQAQDEKPPTPTFSGTQQTWYEGGQLQAERSYQNGKPIGTWKTYHENGQLKTLVTYDEHHYRQGTYQAFHPSGLLQVMGGYYDDYKMGEWNEYSSEGILLERKNYQGSILKGPYFAYHPNGTLKHSGQYRVSRQFVKAETTEQGETQYVYDLVGIKTGTWNTYDLFGTLVHTEEHRAQEGTR